MQQDDSITQPARVVFLLDVDSIVHCQNPGSENRSQVARLTSHVFGIGIAIAIGIRLIKKPMPILRPLPTLPGHADDIHASPGARYKAHEQPFPK